MDLVLAGVVLPNVENHSLRRLAHAARHAGHTAETVPFNGFHDIAETAALVLARRPAIFGLSMQAGETALASAILLGLLRARGFAGMLVAGGHFATLNAEELIREIGALDLVVRFAGEPALGALLRGARDPAALAGLPGAVFRDASGATRFGAAPALDPRPSAGTDGEDQPVHLGFPAADLVLSRGCQAHCSYCCVAGASDLAEDHGARYRRTPTDEIADEIARLYHRRGVRVFNFMDDNLLPLESDEARTFVERLADALGARRVGRIAFSLQLRADVCTPEVVAALARLGLVRAYVGVDGYSGRQLAALGRAAPSHAGAEALARLSAAGVFSVANALLLGPTFRFADLCAEIDALATIRGAPVHLLPIDVRAGSTYFERVRRRGLLEGGFLRRRYRFVDPRTALLGEAVTGLPTRLEEYSVPIALYDLGYNLGIARRLVPDADTDGAAEVFRDVTARWNADQDRFLRGAAAAADTLDRAAVQRFIEGERVGVRALDDDLRQRVAAALAGVEEAVSRARRIEAHAHRRGRLLASVALSTALAACGDRPLAVRDAGGASDGRRLLDAITIIQTGVPLDAQSRECGDGGRIPHGVVADAAVPVGCSGLPADAELVFDDKGIPTDVVASDGGVIADDVRVCVLVALGGACYPSLAGMRQPVDKPHLWIA